MKKTSRFLFQSLIPDVHRYLSSTSEASASNATGYPAAPLAATDTNKILSFFNSHRFLHLLITVALAVACFCVMKFALHQSLPAEVLYFSLPILGLGIYVAPSRKTIHEENQPDPALANEFKGMMFLNEDGEIFRINSCAEYLFGYRPWELLGSRIDKLIPERFLSSLKDLENSLQKHENRSAVPMLDLQGLHKNGTEFPIRMSWSDFHSDEDRFIIVFITSAIDDVVANSNTTTDTRNTNPNRDTLLSKKNKQLEDLRNQLKNARQDIQRLTEQKKQLENQILKSEYVISSITPHLPEHTGADEATRLEAVLAQILEKEKDAEILRSKSQFINRSSHKLRTPLSTILTAVFLLENYTGADFQKEKPVLLDRIRNAVQNIVTLLNDLDSLCPPTEESTATVAEDDHHRSEVCLPPYPMTIPGEKFNFCKPDQQQ